MIKDYILRDFFTVNGWTQGTYARNQFNNIVSTSNPLACSFCLMGAIYNISNNLHDFDLHNKIHDAIVQETNCITGSLPIFNDQYLKSKDDLMAFLEKYKL